MGKGLMMKKTIVIAIVLLSVGNSWAGGSQWEDSLEFLTGIFVAYGVHEGGHALAAWATNTDTIWSSGTYNQLIAFEEEASSRQDGVILHGSGLVAQALLSELVLYSDLDKNTPFVRGMMLWNVVNPIVYALDYWWIRRTNQEGKWGFQGDLEGVEHHSSERTANVFAAGMAAIAINQGYRFAQTQDWCPDWMKREDLRLGMVADGQGSVGLVVEVDF